MTRANRFDLIMQGPREYIFVFHVESRSVSTLTLSRMALVRRGAINILPSKNLIHLILVVVGLVSSTLILVVLLELFIC